MELFHYKSGKLYCEEIPVADLAAKYGTPLYIYSQAAILGQLKALQDAFSELKPLVCYSVKANSNLSILKVMADNASGFDVVSGGELFRVQTAGGDPGKTVFAGVGKTDEEIAAGINAGVLMFNVESEAELDAIARVAKSIGKVAPIALRVNPDVDPKTHRYISTGKKESKFGMDIDRSLRLAEQIVGLSSVSMIGMHMHIGSQITTTDPYAGAATKAVDIIAQLRGMGHPIEWFNMGGGFGIAYRGNEAKQVAEFAKVVVPIIKSANVRLAMEPGRVIAGNSGLLVSKVLYTKQSGDKRFVIQDAAMNDLIRPAFYDAYHEIVPVRRRAGATVKSDVVGGICESGDYFAKDRPLPPVGEGELLALLSAGAYGSVMGSNYNSRPLAAEVLVRGRQAALVRQRQAVTDIWRDERLPGWQRPS